MLLPKKKNFQKKTQLKKIPLTMTPALRRDKPVDVRPSSEKKNLGLLHKIMSGSDLAPMAPGEGNTNPPPTKRINGAKKWCFTWNNYPENWVDLLAPALEGSKWIGGREVAPTTGTPHIQGFIEFPVKVRPIGYKGIPTEIKWIVAKGTVEQNREYCSKGGDFTGNIKVPRPLPKIELYGWQLKAQEQFESVQDNRSIFWWWSEEGGKGKSSFVRWAVERNALITAGAPRDMKFLVVKYNEKHGIWPDVLIFNIPREHGNNIAYGGLEELKDGVFASTKYECDTVLMPYPHVFVFANAEPRIGALSEDRLVVNKID